MSSITPRTNDAEDAWRVLRYFGPLAALLYALDPLGPFFDIAVTALMKMQLHATASQSAAFRLLTAVPVYAAFLIGLTRDRWRPLGYGDRGHFLLFGLATAAVMAWLALRPLQMSTLLIGVLAVMITTRFLMAAFQGALADYAQRHAMSGRLAAGWQFVTFSVTLLGAASAGLVSSAAQPRVLFGSMAVLALAVAAFGSRGPLRSDLTASVPADAPKRAVRADLKRLLRHRAVYPAVLAMMAFQFSPAQGVVLQYYLSEHLNASHGAYGYWYAAFLCGFLPMFVLYGALCQRLRFDRLLRYSAMLAVAQMLPLLAAHSAEQAIGIAVLVGMMGGLMWAALHDLAIRSCPAGLEGTLMMVISGVNAFGVRAGDLVGSRLYEWQGSSGFAACVVLTTVVYALLAAGLASVSLTVPLAADGQRTSGP